VVLREVVQTSLQPDLYADAGVAVKTLLLQGYVLVCLPILGPLGRVCSSIFAVPGGGGKISV
jgi:hypothetical protein